MKILLLIVAHILSDINTTRISYTSNLRQSDNMVLTTIILIFQQDNIYRLQTATARTLMPFAMSSLIGITTSLYFAQAQIQSIATQRDLTLSLHITHVHTQIL